MIKHMKKSLLTFSLSLIFGFSATPTIFAAVPQSPASTTATATVRATVKSDDHLWNLQDVDIKRVVAEMSRETGKNFILDPQVQGKISIISSHPMGAEESYQVFLSSLRLLGYSVVPDGRNLKIVPNRDAANQSIVVNAQNPGMGDEAVVRVVPVRYVVATQLVPALRPLMPTWGNMSVYQPTNSLILSGSADNVQRLADIVRQVDTPDSNGIDIIHLEHAVADDVVDEVNKILLVAKANGSNPSASLSSDSQSNSILVGGDAPTRLHLKVLIAKLDTQNASGTDNTQVIYLQYIQVKDILPILKGMVNQTVSYALTMSMANYSQGQGNQQGSGGSTFGQPSPQFLAAANSLMNNATLNSSIIPVSDKNKVTIVGDVTNNALVVSANPTLMMQLKRVIKKLDVPPRQVLVQSVIAEVDMQTAQELGIQWGTGVPQTNATTNQPGNDSGGAASNYSYSGGMGVGFIQSGDLRALVEMLQTDSNSNIVSTPSVTVLNNSPADIEVGEDISQVSAQYPSGYQPGQGSYPPPTTYNDKQIGLTLQVIPQIMGDQSVRLIIDQENSALIDDAQTTANNPNQPTTDEQISTQVLVNDGQILVLGGLIDAQDSDTVHKVPILGDIPLIGRLFQSHSSHTVKRDLMIFLRPIVIENQAQTNQITKNRYDFMRDVAILNGNDQSEFIASSTLPMRHNQSSLPTPFDSKTPAF